MPSVSVERRTQPAYVIGSVDVSWSPNVVAVNKGGGQGSHARVGDVSPGRPANEDGMATLTFVGGGKDVAEPTAPGVQHALDGFGGEIRPIREHDDRSLHLRPEGGQTTAERGARAALPVRTVDDADARSLERVGAGDDHDLVHRTLPETLEDPREQEALLGAAEASCRPGRENDRGDQPTAASARSISARAI
jgi:hypothetical protein